MLSGKARYLQQLYDEGKLTDTQIDNAVTKGWITTEEKNEIISG